MQGLEWSSFNRGGVSCEPLPPPPKRMAFCKAVRRKAREHAGIRRRVFQAEDTTRAEALRSSLELSGPGQEQQAG